MQTYEIVFSGQLVAGAQPEKVHANLARLFNADERRMATLLSGRRLILKSNLDVAAAEKYRATLERAGAVVEVNAIEQMEEVELAPPPDQPSWVRHVPGGKGPESEPGADVQASAARLEPRDLYMAAFTDVVAPDFGIALLGADVQDPKAPVKAPVLDLSGLSLAPAGSDMGQARTKAAPVIPDTSHLTLAQD